MPTLLEWTRNQDGSYTRTGEPPVGNPWVGISIAGSRPMVTRRFNDALRIIEQAMETSLVRAESYAILPAESPTKNVPMSEETKQELHERQEAKKADRPPAPTNCLTCGGTLPPQAGRGRRRKYCETCRPKLTKVESASTETEQKLEA